MWRFLSAFALMMAPFWSGVALADRDDIASLVARKAAILEILHSKAEKSLVTLAQDDSYADYFRTGSQEERNKLRERIEQISQRAQSRFAVEEMCLIDPSGAEVARIVGGHIAHDLSTEEASAIFFEPGFAQSPRTVHVSPAYMSPDADKWVVAYVTPIEVDGTVRAILHYEHGLDVYQKALAQDAAGEDPWFVVLDPDGRILVDSRRSIAIEKQGDSDDPADYFEAFEWHGFDLPALKHEIDAKGESGLATLSVDGVEYGIAYRAVHDWTLVGIGRL